MKTMVQSRRMFSASIVVLAISITWACCFVQKATADTVDGISFSVASDTNSIEAGQPVWLNIMMENRGTNEVFFLADRHIYRMFEFAVKCEGKAVPLNRYMKDLAGIVDPADLNPDEQSSKTGTWSQLTKKSIRPGETFNLRVKLSLICDMTRIGVYTIKVAAPTPTPVVPPKAGTMKVLRSDEVRVEVKDLPADTLAGKVSPAKASVEAKR